MAQFRNVCYVYTTTSCLPLVREHFIAMNNRGGYIKENILPACESCNSSKNDNLFEDWYPKYKFYNKERESIILEYINSNKENTIPLAFTIK